MPYLTLGEAAKNTKKSKATILNAIRKGRISAKKNDAREWQIDPAELHRVYPPVSLNSLKGVDGEHHQTPSNTNINSALEKEIELLRERLEEKDKSISDLRQDREDLRKDRDHWRDQAERTSLLLTDQREKSSQKVADGRLTLWQWLGIAKR